MTDTKRRHLYLLSLRRDLDIARTHGMRIFTHGDAVIYQALLRHLDRAVDALIEERDALRARVQELEAAA